MPISVEKLRKKLLAAISIGNFQKVEKCVEDAESEHVKNEILNSREIPSCQSTKKLLKLYHKIKKCFQCLGLLIKVTAA